MRKGLIHPSTRRNVVDVRQWLESTKKRGMALGLTQTKTVLSRLAINQPDHILHVAGSNGKGTVSALMAATLCLEGIHNVLFTSPHVARIEERIRRNGKPISREEFDHGLIQVHAAAHLYDDSSIELTFFEVTYLVAMVCSSGSAVLILETGLGGRLDATRSGPATACLLTSISLEHRDILGPNRTLIAREKAAIARPGCPLIVRELGDQNVTQAVQNEAEHAGNIELNEIPSPAKAVFIPIPDGVTVRDEAVILARAMFQAAGLPMARIEQAKDALRWPARMHRLSAKETGSHPYLLDAAHNPSGLLRVASEIINVIENEAPRSVTGPIWSLVFASSPQHDVTEFIQPLLEICRQNPPQNIVLTVPEGGRYPGISTEKLCHLPWPITPQIQSNPSSTVDFLSSLESSQVGLVVSIGSLYLQGNILNAIGWATDENLSLVAKQ